METGKKIITIIIIIIIIIIIVIIIIIWYQSYHMLYILIGMSVDISFLSGSPVGLIADPLGGQGLKKCGDCSAGGRVIYPHRLPSGYVV